jgi:hypothetical protein
MTPALGYALNEALIVRSNRPSCLRYQMHATLCAVFTRSLRLYMKYTIAATVVSSLQGSATAANDVNTTAAVLMAAIVDICEL